MSYSWYGLNRTWCDVCGDMRELLKNSTTLVSNKEVLLSLVEELQIYGNRMEHGLHELKDIESAHEEIVKLKREMKKLSKKKKKLENSIEGDET